MIVLRTENSTYEVERTERKVRRVTSTHQATERMNVPDGTWMYYRDVKTIGDRVFFIWDYTEGGLARGTMTSPVLSMEAGSWVEDLAQLGDPA